MNTKLVNNFNMNDLVIVEIPNSYKFEGRVVGKGIENVYNSFIIECTDGFIPNEIYKFTTVIVLSTFMKIKTNSSYPDTEGHGRVP